MRIGLIRHGQTECNYEGIIQGREKRTSVRIKNIPVKYSNQDFMKEIDTRMGFNMNINYRNYDLFYLPMNYSNTRNLGYAFINFVDPICIIDFLYRFKGIKLKSSNCHKECQITFAKYQGRKEITSHLLNSSGEGKKPFLFTILIALIVLVVLDSADLLNDKKS